VSYVCSSQLRYLLQHPASSQNHFSNPQLLNCKIASSLCLLQRELLESINSLLSSISVLSNNYIETKSKMPRHSPFKNFQLRYKCKSGSMQHQSSRIVEVLYKRRSPRFVSPTIVPWFLHLCSASRQAALQKYQPLNFGTYFTGTYGLYSRLLLLFFSQNVSG
jgi:hypothetical protein